MYLSQIIINWGLIAFIAFCITAGIQILYYLFIFKKFASYTTPEKVLSQEYPVSIIICARDEAEDIASNLPGVLVQKYRTTHEVVLVNDNSTDETKYLIEEFQRIFKQLQPVILKQEAVGIPGKKFPLSVGIKSAKHEVLLLTDADCVPASELWLQKMQDAYTDGIDIVLGYGAYQKKPGLLNKLIRFETFHTALQYFSYALSGMPYMGVGRNLSYKRELFLQNKGFSSINHIPGGDDDLFIGKVATKNNTAIVTDHEAYTISQPKTDFASWQKQKFRHYTTSKYYQPKIKFLLGIYGTTYLLLIPLFVLSIILYNWWIACSIYAVRLLLLAFVWNKSMKKLNEQDLWNWFILLDAWMFIYHLLFLPAVWKKPARQWK